MGWGLFLPFLMGDVRDQGENKNWHWIFWGLGGALLLSAAQARGNPPETLYGYFTNALDAALTETARSLEELDDPKDLARTALDLALRSYANQLACARLLDIMQESGQAGPSPKKTTK